MPSRQLSFILLSFSAHSGNVISLSYGELGAASPDYSAVVQLCQIVPYTAHLPSRTCRSWWELRQRSAPLELWQIVACTTDLPSRTCRCWQELSSARQCWSCGRLFLTPHICHPGPAGLGRNSAALAVVADCSLHRTYANSRTCRSWQELRQCSAVLELWESVPCTTNLPSKTCRSWQELSSAQQCWSLWQIVPYTAHLPSKTCRSWQELSSVGAMSQIVGLTPQMIRWLWPLGRVWAPAIMPLHYWY